jgi:CubicO group peptidase (beta-lactamase class C family)
MLPIVAALCAVLLAAPLAAQTAPSSPTDRVPPALDGLPAFVDSLFTAQMEKHAIPGAGIVVVRGDSVVFTRSFGVADVTTGRPFSADSTRLKMGSISKLFVTTAVLQLAEARTVDLHQDVNAYLRAARLRNRFEPVTLHHLLTHTSGIDRPYLGIASRSTRVQPFEAFLLRTFPPQIRPPGELYAYSDYGMALAGYVVEQVTGEPFARYVGRSVLEPLGMHQSSFEPQRFPDGEFAAGYRWENAERVPYVLVDLNLLPSGNLSSTLSDMSRFIAAQLSGGELSGRRVLSGESVRTMQRRQFGHHPRVPGVGYAFHESWYFGERALRHNGWMSGHATVLHLSPEQDIGYLAVFTGDGYSETIWELTKYLYRDHAGVDVPDESVPGARERAAGYAGRYRMMEYAEQGPERSAHVLLAPTVELRDNGDGTLTLVRPEGEVRLLEVDIGVLVWEDGYEHLVVRDHAGGLELLMGPHVYRKVPWHDSPEFHLALIAGSVFLFVGFPAVWGVRALRRRSHAGVASPLARISVAAALLFCVGALVMLLAIVPALTSSDINLLAMGAPPLLRFGLMMPLVLLPLALALPALAAVSWYRREWGAPARVLYSALAAVALIFMACMHSLGFLVIPGLSVPSALARANGPSAAITAGR